jgi:hypothetical protein
VGFACKCGGPTWNARNRSWLSSTAGDKADEPEAGHDHPDGVSQPDDDGSISPGDRAAYRAMRVALVSLWLMGLIHPYSLLLSVRALGRGDLSAVGPATRIDRSLRQPCGVRLDVFLWRTGSGS